MDLILQPMFDTYSNLYGIPNVNRKCAFPNTFFERINDLWLHPNAFFQERVEVNGGNFCGSLKDCSLCQAAIDCDWCLKCVDYCVDRLRSQIYQLRKKNQTTKRSANGSEVRGCLFFVVDDTYSFHRTNPFIPTPFIHSHTRTLIGDSVS
jgi:hypothetical protein